MEIICPAIHFQDGKQHNFQPTNIEKGFVLCCMSYTAGYYILSYIKGLSDSTKTEGFLTSSNEFVDPYEALRIALKANQITKESIKNKEKLSPIDLFT